MAKILICGDFTTCSRGSQAVKGNTALSPEVLSAVKSSDCSIVNLEAPVAVDNDQRIAKIGPCIRTDKGTVSYLKDCGFNAVTLANNHFFDYGSAGVEKTVAALNEKQVSFVGGGRNEKELRKILYYSLQDITIAVLNYCEHEFSIQNGIGSNPIDLINAYHDITEAKQHADYVMVITHSGIEGYNLPTPRMQRNYRHFIDLGADVVINHHQHCYSGYEVHNGKPIFYGLGNFFFDSIFRNTPDSWFEGYMVLLELNKENGATWKLLPYTQCKEDVLVQLMAEEQGKDFENKITSLNEIIKSPERLQEELVRYANGMKKSIFSWFMPYTNRWLLAAARRNLLPSFLGSYKRLQLYSRLQCESHFDITKIALK